MTDLTRLSAAALADSLGSGEVSSVEATQAHLDRIAAVDGAIHAFLHVSGEQALRRAALGYEAVRPAEAPLQQRLDRGGREIRHSHLDYCGCEGDPPAAA